MLTRLVVLLGGPILMIFAGLGASAASDGCSRIEQAGGPCATTNGSSIELRGTTTAPGTSRRNGAPRTEPVPKPTATRNPCITTRIKCGGKQFNFPTNPAIGQRDGFHVTMSGPVKITDLIGFTPVPGVDHMEPNGWSVVGVDTNFFATTGPDIQTGVLLGKPASVRFTPKTYRWTYGDGTAATLGTGGRSWKSRGDDSFDPTPTSHRYARIGSYTISLTIEFGAEYKYLLDDWIPIAGTLPVPTNPLTTTVGTAKTVLVARDCLQDPHGPGC